MEDLGEEDCINFTFDNIEEFKKHKWNNNEILLQILSLNIRSLRKNWDTFLVILEESDTCWDLILISEINIKNNETMFYNLNDYTAVWKTREETKRGGGLVMFVKNTYLDSMTNKISNIEGNEMIELVIEKSNKKFVFIGVYRQPSTDIKKFIKGISSKLKEWSKHDEVYWLGDINIDILDNRGDSMEKKYKKYQNTMINQYENLLAVNGFEKKIGTVTREEVKGTRVTKSCIDHIYVKSKEWKTYGLVIKEKISDHYMTAAVTTQNNGDQDYSSKKTNKVNKIRNTNKIIKEMGNCDWSTLDGIVNNDLLYKKVEETISKIYEQNTKIKRIYNQNITTKEVKIKKEWITKDIVKEINEKNKMWKSIRKLQNKEENIDLQLIQKYNMLKNKIRRNIERSKQEFYRKKIENSKDIWDMVNKMTKQKKKSIDETIGKNFCNMECKEICNNFNKNFMDLTVRLRNKYNQGKKNKVEKNKPSRVAEENNVCEHATQQDFINIMKFIKITDAEGYDEFSLRIFKKNPKTTAELLTKITNSIIQNCLWPKKLKISVVRPIYKKGKKNVCDNYRPVALLPALNKPIEKFFANQLNNFLEKNSIIIKEQYGFQKGKGTVDALKEINEKITDALSSGKKVGAIFIDLQKAFDTVNRSKLLNKLVQIGIEEKFVKIMGSYLEKRESCVRVDNQYSELIETNYGVPQGSILGPIFFLNLYERY